MSERVHTTDAGQVSFCIYAPPSLGRRFTPELDDLGMVFTLEDRMNGEAWVMGGDMERLASMLERAARTIREAIKTEQGRRPQLRVLQGGGGRPVTTEGRTDG